MATHSVTDNQLDLSAFLAIEETDSVTFRGATLPVASRSFTNIDDLVLTVELADDDGRIRARLIKVVSADDPDYDDAVAAVS